MVVNCIVSKDTSVDFATEEEADKQAWLLALLRRDDEMPTFDLRDEKGNFQPAKSASKCTLAIRPSFLLRKPPAKQAPDRGASRRGKGEHRGRVINVIFRRRTDSIKTQPILKTDQQADDYAGKRD
jgi:hypothetical protein